jgi:hypothetical protein
MVSSVRAPYATGTTFRVMTYNILFGGVGRVALLREVVSAVNPDVAVFCEVTAQTCLQAIASTVGSHCVQSGPGRERVAIVSRWPIIRADLFGPPWAARKWIAATIQPNDGPPMRVLAAHLFPQPLWPFEILRLLQIRVLLRQLRSHAGPFQILAGDFNAVARGDPVRRDGAPRYVRAQWWIQGGTIPRWALGRLTAAIEPATRRRMASQSCRGNRTSGSTISSPRRRWANDCGLRRSTTEASDGARPFGGRSFNCSVRG